MRHLYYTLQTLLRGHGGTAEKIISLTLGLAMGVLLFAQIAYELSFDRFYPNPDTLVMLRMRNVTKGVPEYGYNYGTYRPAAADLSEAFPELVESASLTSNLWTPAFYKDDKKLDDIQTLFADTAYFATTGLTLLKGDPKDLALHSNAFISESMARQLYGDESPIGKELSVEKLFNVTIRGVYADVPRNSIMPHDLLLPMAAMDWAYGAGTWGTNNLYGVLFRLKQPTDVDAMNSRIQKAVEQYTDPHLGDDVVTEYSVLPLYKVYRSLPDSTRRLVILGVLGFSIFFVSILNYVLRAVAAMSRRAKQVGVHKCSGADGWHILSMFLWETGLLVAASIVCGGALLWLLRGQVEELLGSRLSDLFTWQTLYVPLGTVLLLFLVAGVVPGRIYARIPVTQVFRRYTDGKRSWKRGLLTVQFIGVAFIGGMLLTTVWQYHDLMTRSVGFHAEGLAVGTVTGNIERAQGVADAIRREPYVEAVAGSGTSLLAHYSTNRLTDNQGNFICPLHFTLMDKEMPQVTGMTLLEGHWPQHRGEAVVGRTTVETLKWGDTAIGRKLPVDPSWARLEEQPVVTGVVEDVRNMGFFQGQTCTAFILNDRVRTFNVRLKAPLDENLKRLNAFVKSAYPDLSLEFTTYQDIRREQNASVSTFRNTVWVTTACIILIVLMGLIGYVSDETQRRSKEIAVRKVNGAEASDILRLLSVDILKIAVLAVAAGIAAAWYVSGQWMQQFADSRLLSPAWYALLALLLLVLIVAVVVLKAWRIANENPVLSIKSE
ncbi:efflux ABC transporter permease protein [Bacteroides sp. CAG:598]|nr:efflux ABC transporter permease protein [Bacteroides sp. CAG:598]